MHITILIISAYVKYILYIKYILNERTIKRRSILITSTHYYREI